MLDMDTVSQHDSRESCWVVISGQAYDITDYIDQHPGGAQAILRYAGKDATDEYEPIHPAGTIEKTLSSDKHLGPVTPSSGASSRALIAKRDQVDRETTSSPLSVCQNLDDFEVEAKRKLSQKAWVYYHSAADSLASSTTNKLDWTKISFRPRVLRNVARVSMQRSFMGHDSAVPFFIAPAAMAKLGHPDGELCLARGAAWANIPYCASTYSSTAHEDLAGCFVEKQRGGALVFQLYIPIAKKDATKLIARAKQLKCTALVLTVDCAVVGKREEDDRYKAQVDHDSGVIVPRSTNLDPNADAPILRGAHSSTLDWADLLWIRKAWGNSGPFILKGIQTVEDAKLAADIKVDGIYLSNHGGRQLDFAPSSISTLLEIKKFAPEVLDQVEVYLDGGVTRGTDVLKALCLGARAVGLGRPFMYALSAYGTEGVSRAIKLLSEEIETSMRLLGVTELSQLRDFHVNASRLEQELPKRVDMRELQRLSRL